jgi:hypothetical protein
VFLNRAVPSPHDLDAGLGESVPMPILDERSGPDGAGNGTRTLDNLLGRTTSALSNLIQAPKGVFGPSWPSGSKGRGPSSPPESNIGQGG